MSGAMAAPKASVTHGNPAGPRRIGKRSGGSIVG